MNPTLIKICGAIIALYFAIAAYGEHHRKADCLAAVELIE